MSARVSALELDEDEGKQPRWKNIQQVDKMYKKGHRSGIYGPTFRVRTRSEWPATRKAGGSIFPMGKALTDPGR